MKEQGARGRIEIFFQYPICDDNQRQFHRISDAENSACPYLAHPALSCGGLLAPSARTAQSRMATAHFPQTLFWGMEGRLGPPIIFPLCFDSYKSKKTVRFESLNGSVKTKSIQADDVVSSTAVISGCSFASAIVCSACLERTPFHVREVGPLCRSSSPL